MAIRQYIGARYVPKFMGTYDPSINYENLCVVDDGAGTSYISDKLTPAGTPLTDTTYWHLYGTTNGAIINLQNQIGDLTDLDTSTQANLVDAINEIYPDAVKADVMADSEPINVLLLGIKNDGSEDCSVIVNEATKTKQLYFPTGEYRFDAPFVIANSIYGASNARVSGRTTKFICNFDNGPVLSIDNTYNATIGNIEIKNIFIDCDARTGSSGIESTSTRYMNIENVSVYKFAKYGMSFQPTASSSRNVFLSKIDIDGGLGPGPETSLYGLYMSNNAVDSRIEGLTVMHCAQNVYCAASGSRFNDIHLFAGRTDLADPNTYFDRSINFEGYGFILADNVYLDSALQGWVQRSGIAMIGNIAYFNDNSLTSQYTGNNKINAFRAIGNAGQLLIDNAFVGGSTNKWSNVSSYVGTTIKDIKFGWNGSAIMTPDGAGAFTRTTIGKRHILVGTENASRYICALVIKNNTSGRTVLRVARQSFGSRIVIQSSGAGAANVTFTNTALDGYNANVAFYKIDNNLIYLYFDCGGGSLTDVTIEDIGDVGNGGVYPIDLTNIVNMTLPTQADTTGLIQI